MIKDKDLSQIKKYVIDILPQLLREEPEILTTIEGIIAQHFPQREEFARLVEEIKLLREEMERRFEQQVEKRLEQMDKRFEQVEKHLEQVDKRFEQVEKRLEQMDKRFEQVEKRLDQVDKRLEQVEKRLDQQQQQIDLLREEMNQRFEQVDKRLDQQQQQIDLLREEMNQRFERVEKRLDQQQQQIDLLREEMNRRFEEVEKRLEQIDTRLDQQQQQIDLLREEMNRRFEEVEKRLEQIDTRLDQQQQQIDLLHKDVLDLKRQMTQMTSDMGQMNRKITQFDGWLKLISGTKGDEKGQTLEQAFALGLSYGLKDRDIKPETIQLRQIFVDSEGVVFSRKEKWIEIDLIAENEKLTVFEVKTSSQEIDVEIFAKKMKVVQLAHPEKQVQGIFISPGASEVVEQHCQEWGIQFLG